MLIWQLSVSKDNASIPRGLIFNLDAPFMSRFWEMLITKQCKCGQFIKSAQFIMWFDKLCIDLEIQSWCRVDLMSKPHNDTTWREKCIQGFRVECQYSTFHKRALINNKVLAPIPEVEWLQIANMYTHVLKLHKYVHLICANMCTQYTQISQICALTSLKFVLSIYANMCT